MLAEDTVPESSMLKKKDLVEWLEGNMQFQMTGNTLGKLEDEMGVFIAPYFHVMFTN